MLRSHGGPSAALEPVFGTHGHSLDILARQSTCPKSSFCKCWEAPSTCDGFGSDCECGKECAGDSHCQWWLATPRCTGSGKRCGHDLVPSGGISSNSSLAASCDPTALKRLGVDAEWFAQVCGTDAEAVCSDACKGAVARLYDHVGTCPGAAFLRPEALRAVRDAQNAAGCERYAGASTGLNAVPPSQRAAYTSGKAALATGSAEPEPLPHKAAGPGANMAKIVAQTLASANKNADAQRKEEQATRGSEHEAEAERLVEAAKAHLADVEAQRAAAAEAVADGDVTAVAEPTEEEMAAAAARLEAAEKAAADAVAAKEAAEAAKQAEADAKTAAAAAKEEEAEKRVAAGKAAREAEEAEKAADGELGAEEREKRVEAEAEEARARAEAAEADRLDEEARKAEWAAGKVSSVTGPVEEKKEEEEVDSSEGLNDAQLAYERAMAAKDSREGPEEEEEEEEVAAEEAVPEEEEEDADALAAQEAMLRDEMEMESADAGVTDELEAEAEEESAEAGTAGTGGTGATGNALAERLAELAAMQEEEQEARDEEEGEKSAALLAEAEAKKVAREEAEAAKVEAEETEKAKEEEAVRVSAAWHASGASGATGATGAPGAGKPEAAPEAGTDSQGDATGATEAEVGAEVALELKQHRGSEPDEPVYEAGVFLDGDCSVRVSRVAIGSGGACVAEPTGMGAARAEFADGDVTLEIFDDQRCAGPSGVITGKVGSCMGVAGSEGDDGQHTVHVLVSPVPTDGLSVSVFADATCSGPPLHHETRAAGDACGVFPSGSVSYAVEGEEVTMSMFPDIKCAAAPLAAHVYPLEECASLAIEGLPSPVYVRFETFSNDSLDAEEGA